MIRVDVRLPLCLQFVVHFHESPENSIPLLVEGRPVLLCILDSGTKKRDLVVLRLNNQQF